MSSPRTEFPDEPVEKPKSQLSPVQLAAGALASVSAAVVASFFGLAGTLIGAALASVISTVSAALYTNSISRTNEQLRKVRSQLVPAVPRSRTGERPAAAAAFAPDGTRVLPAALDPRRAPAPRRGPRWPRIAGYAVAVFGLAMAIVTGIEVVGQQPVSALVGAQEASSATTLGELTGGSSSADGDSPATPTTTPAPSTTSEAPGSDAATESTADADGSAADSTGTTSPTATQRSTAESSSSSSPRASSPAPQTPQGGTDGSPDAAAGTPDAP